MSRVEGESAISSEGGPGTYRLISEGTDSEALYRLGLFFGGRPVPWLAAFGGLVIQSSWLNDGFTHEKQDGSTLEQ